MPEVCLVIPCFNEERRLPGAVLIDFLDRHPHVGFCLVDDGSRDGTRAVLEAVRAQRPGRVLVLTLDRNRGKAEAIRQGVRHVASTHRHAFIGYWDADLSTPLDESLRLAEVLEQDAACHLVMGARVKRLGAQIERRLVRHLLGRTFSTAASLVLGVSFYDSQCGAKIFRAEDAERLFSEPFLSPWLFDLEILIRLRDAPELAGLNAVREVPLNAWREVGGSKLRLTHMLSVPVELLRIRARYGDAPRRSSDSPS